MPAPAWTCWWAAGRSSAETVGVTAEAIAGVDILSDGRVVLDVTVPIATTERQAWVFDRTFSSATRLGPAILEAQPLPAWPSLATACIPFRLSTASRRRARHSLIPRAEPARQLAAAWAGRQPSFHGRQLPDGRAERRVQSSEERYAGRFQLALGETGTGGGDAGRQIDLVRAHCGLGIGVRCDHLDAAALLAQGLDLALQVGAG